MTDVDAAKKKLAEIRAEGRGGYSETFDRSKDLLLNTVEAVLELHKPERRWQADASDDFSFDTAREAWVDLHEEKNECAPDEIDESKLSYFDICSECGSLEMGDDPEDKLYRDSLYPCATVRTVLEAMGVTE